MQQSQKQAVRLRRALFANIGTLINAFMCLLGAKLGYFELDTHTVFLLSAGIWFGHLLFVGLIFSGLNLHFPVKDLSFTVPQMVWVTVSISVMLFFTDELRPLMMMAYLLVLLFGAFYLSLRGFIYFTIFAVSCYLAVIYQVAQTRPWTVDWVREFVVLMAFLSVMTGFSFVGGEISNLRRTLMGRNRDIQSAYARIEELAVTDDLTGLFNRRYLLDNLQQKRAMANRSQYRFVLCYIDLDHFKKVNDVYGHVLGDKVLQAFAEVTRESLREVDIAARMGGEEFVLVLADTSLISAQKVCSRIARRLAQVSFTQAPELHLTMSVGITCFQPAESIDQTLERADNLLYEAKSGGRNRIMMEEGVGDEHLSLPFAGLERRAM
jgi:diguanylate cyclase